MLLLFFVIAVLDALLFYFLYDSTRLFAVMTVVGAIGIIVAISWFDVMGSKRKNEPKVKVYSEENKAQKNVEKKKKTERKKPMKRKKKAGRKNRT